MIKLTYLPHRPAKAQSSYYSFILLNKHPEILGPIVTIPYVQQRDGHSSLQELLQCLKGSGILRGVSSYAYIDGSEYFSSVNDVGGQSVA